MMKFSVRLKAKYQAEINTWDWDKILAHAEDNPWASGSDAIIGSDWLGQITAVFPSGKIYAAWTSNQSARDEIRDRLFGEALDEAAAEHGMYIDFIDDGVYAVIVLGTDEDIFFQNPGFTYMREHIADTEEELRRWMDEHKYWPNIWSISDHGNVSRYELEEPSA